MSALDPDRRTAFVDALRPPPGYLLDAGVGTTFSLDFEPFTGIVLAFVGADVEDERPDHASVMTAMARLQHRLRVFVNAGGFRAPRTANRLFALYDRVVHSVALEGAAFHPKVWILKFTPQAKPEMRKAVPVYRVLCASRNVTTANTWELAAAFEGEQGRRSDLGKDLAGFCKSLAKRSRGPEAIWKLASELPEVDFEIGREAQTALRFRWQWPGRSALHEHLPTQADRALLISPFVRADFLRDLSDRVKQLTVVSTQVELDALPEDTHERLRGVTTYVVTGTGTDEVPPLDLHAKLLAWERGDSRETLLGSANGTGAAWGLNGRSNCEAMLALRPGVGIDDALRSFVAPEKGVLRPWIEVYRRQQPEIDEEAHARRRLDALQRQLATVHLMGTHDPRKERLTLRGVGSPPPALVSLPAGVTADMSLLLEIDDQDAWAPLGGAFRGDGLQFSGIGRADLCAFAVISLRDSMHAGASRRFGIQFELPLSADDAIAREEALNAKLLENADPHRLLLNVLHGVPAGSDAGRNSGAGSRSAGSSESFLQRATFERVMEVCTADPSRIDEIDALLAACRSLESMRSFIAFWTAFKQAAEGQERG